MSSTSGAWGTGWSPAFSQSSRLVPGNWGGRLSAAQAAIFPLLFPLTFASNVFVETETMPGWVQAVVANNPITHLTTAARGLMHGSVDAGAVGWVVAWSVALVAVFGPLTMRLYRAER